MESGYRTFEFRVRCGRCGFDNAYLVQTFGSGAFPKLENPEPPRIEQCHNAHCRADVQTFPLTALVTGQATQKFPDLKGGGQ